MGEADEIFVPALAEIAQSRVVGNGLEPGVHMGPVITPQSKERIQGLIQKGLDEGAELVVGLGGGSAIDVAKLVRLCATHTGPLEQYDDAQNGSARITHPVPPMIAIPTTAGTGSEVGRSGVATLASTGRKTVFFAPRLIPSVAILDPKLTVSMPPAITAATGFDALTHAIEAYCAPGYHPMAEINITPMVDVMLVLLIIFMVTAPLLVAGVPVELPNTSAARISQPKKPVIVSLAGDGSLYIREEQVTRDTLVPKLTALRSTEGDMVVYVRADKTRAYGEVMEILGRVGESGYGRVSLLSQPKANGGSASQGQ